MTTGSVLDSWQTQGLKAGHNPRFLHAVTPGITIVERLGRWAHSWRTAQPIFLPSSFPQSSAGTPG